VKKCSIYLYNFPQNITIPIFTSTAWSYEAQGPVKGSIKTIIMYRDTEENLIFCEVPATLQSSNPQQIQDILSNHKFL